LATGDTRCQIDLVETQYLNSLLFHRRRKKEKTINVGDGRRSFPWSFAGPVHFRQVIKPKKAQCCKQHRKEQAAIQQSEPPLSAPHPRTTTHNHNVCLRPDPLRLSRSRHHSLRPRGPEGALRAAARPARRFLRLCWQVRWRCRCPRSSPRGVFRGVHCQVCLILRC
jgi:hypothetical protein